MVAGMEKSQITKALIAAGAYLAREGKEHEIWRCSCGQHQTPVPRHTTISPGVVSSIITKMACHKKGWLQ